MPLGDLAFGHFLGENGTWTFQGEKIDGPGAGLFCPGVFTHSTLGPPFCLFVCFFPLFCIATLFGLSAPVSAGRPSQGGFALQWILMNIYSHCILTLIFFFHSWHKRINKYGGKRCNGIFSHILWSHLRSAKLLECWLYSEELQTA